MPYDPTWTPARLPGITGYWNGDDLTGANGDPIASWADRINGLALVQATGAKQPTLVTNSGSTGHQGARFTAANSQLLTAARGSNPNQGPYYVWTLHKHISAPAGQKVMVEVANSLDTSHGWAAGYNSGLSSPFIVEWGVATPITGGGNDGTGTVIFREWAFDPVTAHEARTGKMNDVAASTATSSTQPATGAGTITLGGAVSHTTTWMDSEVLVAIVGAGYPTQADRNSFAWWLWVNYGVLVGTGYNPTSPATTNGKGGGGGATTTAIELGVVYNAGNIFSHPYWLAWDPFTAGVVDENPNIAFSSDGNTWDSTGITNPVVAYPGGGAAGNNADCDLLDNVARDSKMYLYYTVENATPTSARGVFVRSTTDGISWGGATQIVNGATGQYECPVTCYDAASALYWMLTMDTVTQKIYWQSSSSPTGAFGAQTLCALAIPGARVPWHIGKPVKFGGRWVMPFSDNDAVHNLWLAASVDGKHWTCATRPIIVPSPANWDSNSAYRPAIQDAGDGANFYLWYVGYSGAQTAARLSTVVTVPQSELPGVSGGGFFGLL